MYTKMITATVALFMAVALPGSAIAGPKHCPPGHAKKGWCNGGAPAASHRRETRREVRRSDHHHDVVLVPVHPGVTIHNYDYRVIDDGYRHRLPPLRAGEQYYIIDGQVVRVDRDTATVLSLMGLANTLLN